MWSGGCDGFENRHYGDFSSTSYNRDQQPACQPIVKICELQPGICKSKVVGIVIAKESPRHFTSKKDPSSERFVMNFTLRDSRVDFINVSCWGKSAYIHDLADHFHIGDVVEVENAIVQSKPSDGSDERYKPWTPSMYQLSLSESRSQLRMYTGWDSTEYMSLSHVPVKATNDYYTLSDILSNGKDLGTEYISLLVAVKDVGAVRSVTTKTSKQLQCCDLHVFDETQLSFKLTLWDEEQICLAQSWIPRDTVVFAADVRVRYDEFRKTMTATGTSKTIFTVNPDTREAFVLHQFAQSVDLPASETAQSTFVQGETSASVDLESIHTVYTVSQILDKEVSKSSGGGTEHAILYGYITALDLDADEGIVVSRCAKCDQRLDRGTNTCTNEMCAQGSRYDLDADSTERVQRFEVRVSVSDQTGSIDRCFLSHDVCQDMFGLSVEHYVALSAAQKTELKWRYLLEQCKIFVKIMLPTYDKPKSAVRILKCEPADQRELAKHL